MTKALMAVAVSAICLCLDVFPIRAEEDTVSIAILHSNDIYGHLQRQKDGAGSRGGMAPGVHLIQQIRATGPALVLDAGDALGPERLSASDQGRTMVEMMRMAGYDAMTPGNHDFGYGLAALSERRGEAEFPFLAANLKGIEGASLPVQSHVLAKPGGVPVGVFGLISPEVAVLTDPKNVAGLTFEDPVKVAGAEVKALRDGGAAYVIALVHMREEEVLSLARKVQGIDLIVAGGYRAMDRAPLVLTQMSLMNGVKIVTTPGNGFYLGRVDVTFAQDAGGAYRAVKVDPVMIPVDASMPDNAEAAQQIAQLEAAYTTASVQVLGRLAEETLDAQAQVVADLMRWRTGAELGIVNRGGFQKVTANAPLALRDVDQFIRFDNKVVTIKLTGKQLRSILSRSQRATGVGTGLIFSGLDQKEVSVSGRPVQDDEPYRVATVAFLADGGDGYVEFKQGEAAGHTGILLRSLTAEALKERGTLSSATFQKLLNKGVWRSGWAVEGAFDRNYIDRTTETYRAQKERVSFLSGNTSVAWNGATHYFLGYEVGRHVMRLESRAEFGQLGSTFGDLEKSNDLLDADATYRYRTRTLKVDPIVSSGLSTALTQTDGRRPMLARGSVGFSRQLSPALTARLSGRAQRDFVVDASDLGVEMILEFQRKLSGDGKLQSRVRSFFGLTDRRVISVENYNTLTFPLIGGLNLAVRQNNFIYRVNSIKGNPVEGVAFRMGLTVGFVYGLDWKWL